MTEKKPRMGAIETCREVVYSAFFLGVAAGALLAFTLTALAFP